MNLASGRWRYDVFLYVLLSFIVACCWFYSVRSRVSVVDCRSLLSVVHYSWWLRVVFRLSKFVAGCGWSLLFDNVGCWPSCIDCRFSAVECPYRLLKKISLSVPTAQLCCDSSAALTCPFKVLKYCHWLNNLKSSELRCNTWNIDNEFNVCSFDYLIFSQIRESL